MKLIFEYEEETTEHVPDVDDNKERERGGKHQQGTLQLNYQKI